MVKWRLPQHFAILTANQSNLHFPTVSPVDCQVGFICKLANIPYCGRPAELTQGLVLAQQLCVCLRCFEHHTCFLGPIILVDSGVRVSPTLRRAYKELGLSSSASPDEIRTAFKHLALQRHPDKGGQMTREPEPRAPYGGLCPCAIFCFWRVSLENQLPKSRGPFLSMATGVLGKAKPG